MFGIGWNTITMSNLFNRQSCVFVQSRGMKFKHLSLQRVHLQITNLREIME